ncbi:hypothetical protein, partial [Roseovarius sp. D22-M7]|uniref:hypothetical protein n=1 Tax=Roseovarius sp. D22-M7 TaxID=3127116 RepID=UPI0030102FFC
QNDRIYILGSTGHYLVRFPTVVVPTPPNPAFSCLRASPTPDSIARYSTTSCGVRETYSIAIISAWRGIHQKGI